MAGRGTDGEREVVLDRIAQTYSRYSDTGYSTRWSKLPGGMRFIVEERDQWLADVLKGASDILDLGCGDANLALTLERLGRRPHRYMGIDLLPDRLERARERVPWGEFTLASADRLPTATSSVDAVVAVTLLSSLPEPWLREGVAAEVNRVLRPGGRFVVYDLRVPNPWNRRVVPIRLSELRSQFSTWNVSSWTMGLLPPLARNRLLGSRVLFRILRSLPPLRSHRGTLLVKPDSLSWQV